MHVRELTTQQMLEILDETVQHFSKPGNRADNVYRDSSGTCCAIGRYMYPTELDFVEKEDLNKAPLVVVVGRLIRCDDTLNLQVRPDVCLALGKEHDASEVYWSTPEHKQTRQTWYFMRALQVMHDRKHHWCKCGLTKDGRAFVGLLKRLVQDPPAGPWYYDLVDGDDPYARDLPVNHAAD